MNEKPFPAWQEPNSLVASAEFSWRTPPSTPARLTSCPSPPRAAPSLRNPLSKVMTPLGEQWGKDVGGEQAKLLQEKEGRQGRGAWPALRTWRFPGRGFREKGL